MTTTLEITKEIAAKAAARSLMSRPFFVRLLPTRDQEAEKFLPHVFFPYLGGENRDRARDVQSIKDCLEHISTKEDRDNLVIPDGEGMVVSGLDNIRAMVVAGFDTGVNDELFPELRKSKISPDRVSQ